MQKATESGVSKPGMLGSAGMFVLDLLGVVLGPAILESALWRLPVHSLVGIVVKKWCLDSVVAAFMGFMMYRAWRVRTSKWAWTILPLWFVCGALTYGGPTRENSILAKHETVWMHFSGEGCAARATGCREVLAFSAPLIRPAAYPGAALLASHILSPATSLIESNNSLKNPSDENLANS